MSVREMREIAYVEHATAIGHVHPGHGCWTPEGQHSSSLYHDIRAALQLNHVSTSPDVLRITGGRYDSCVSRQHAFNQAQPALVQAPQALLGRVSADSKHACMQWRKGCILTQLKGSTCHA